MNTPKSLGAAALLAAALPLLSAPALAADSAELKSLRDEVARMREAYESRINALERRLSKAETTAGKAEAQATQASQVASNASAAASAASAATTRPSNEAAFNPGISLILSGMYTNLKDNANNRPYAINGFVPSNGEVAPPARGFSLGESELVVESNIDSYFRGKMVLAIPPEEGTSPTVEEATIQTLGLSQGLNLKAGRFFSGIGYLNEQHAHAWDFSDAPLAYKAFFGGQQKGEGVQLKWLAPTDTFLEFGVEGGKGGSFPSTNRNKNGFTSGSLFAHVGDDVGIEHSWRAGLSFTGSAPKNRSYSDVDANGVATSNTFSGTSRTWIVDGVWKWAPNGDASQRALKVQGEYFSRRENGNLTCADADAANATNCTGGLTDSISSRQSGWYAQTVYKFAPTWRVGYRYDRLNYGTVNVGSNINVVDLPVLARHNPTRNTVMVDWAPSEFSLLRLQVARDNSRSGSADNQLWLHYIVSLGAHGAHKY